MFDNWLAQHYAEKKEKVLGRLREMRDGELYRSQWGSRMRGEGAFADLFEQVFEKTCQRLGFKDFPDLSADAFCRPNETRKLLFDDCA